MFLGHVIGRYIGSGMASARPVKTRRKRKDRKIDRKSSMPWDKAVYKAQLGKDLQDIQDKLSRIFRAKTC